MLESSFRAVPTIKLKDINMLKFIKARLAERSTQVNIVQGLGLIVTAVTGVPIEAVFGLVGAIATIGAALPDRPTEVQ